MKLRISVLLDLSAEDARNLAFHACELGFDFDGETAPRVLIRRMLEAHLHETVAQCHENREAT